MDRPSPALYLLLAFLIVCLLLAAIAAVAP